MRRVAVACCVFASFATAAFANSRPLCDPRLQGRVVDRAGRPIAGAKLVVEGDLSSPEREKPSTDAHGSYDLYIGAVVFKCPSPMELTVTVIADGYSPRTETKRRSDDGYFHFEHVLDVTPK